MIWCDLDNTLIWRWDPLISSPLLSVAFGLPVETKPPVGKGRRRLGEVRMLTSAIRVYAEAMNVAFDLGFASAEIVAREALNAGASRSVDPTGVLIDNAAQFTRDEQHDLARRRKRLYLGIETSAVVEVPFFCGLTDDSFDREWRSYVTHVRQRICRQ